MSESEFVRQKKAATSTYTNPSLEFSTIPTLANPTRGFGEINTAPFSKVNELVTDSQNTQSAHQQLLQPQTITQNSPTHDISRILLHRPQAQLIVGESNDEYEQEAQQIANQVVSMPDTAVQPKEQIGTHSATLQQKPIIQRFGSLEHKSLGDRGSGDKAYNFQGGEVTTGPENFQPPLKVPFRLTHGDITMLSGDYFDPRDTRVNQQGVEEPVPDSLFRLAATPSPDPGKTPGTQDEIIYAIKTINPQDIRFAPISSAEQPEAGIWAELEFSKAVTDAVDNRYLRLAADNTEHFAAPHGTAGPSGGNRSSAGGSYRALHEDAILRAFFAGQSKQDIGEGMAREAAAHHFLTDHFAAGHLRTPRADIRQYWRQKYPLFFNNMKRKIALDVARYINENTTNGATIFGTVSAIYDTIIAQVQEKTKDMPELGFDDLVALVAHDFDNEQGLWVVNDLGDRWKTFGDSNLNKEDSNNQTAKMAELAVKLGCKDIENAYALGSGNPGPYSDEWILNSVKGQTPSPATPGDRYAPEQVLPRLDPDANNGTQNWQADSLDALWTVKIRSDLEQTYGEAITKSVESGEIKGKLEGMAAKFPENEDVAGGWLGTVHPQAGFIHGFLEPLVANPLVGLRSIIDFNPSEGQAGFNEDDAVMEETTDDLPHLTLNQRADRVRALIGGWTGEDEGERVIEIFRTASVSDRPQLYRLVEGHAWTGDWIEGILTTDDDIVDALYRGQLDRLRDIINGKN
ncbi:MAG: hypothetical protein RMX96_28370 [Nostoc sp. ChiSLP02]|nr:hypothetical protein [Nostoc sp. DedSLP05]MDZ8102017.1 hypothetical protein [Nostoc sp. DedSLP01]MDZ8188753.1 hypothetical protein [Nostoc sp. ChiSLP02]